MLLGFKGGWQLKSTNYNSVIGSSTVHTINKNMLCELFLYVRCRKFYFLEKSIKPTK